MAESLLGYANNFINKPALKSKHQPRGTNKTPPTLKGSVFYRDKLYDVGFRIITGHDKGDIELVHVNGMVFPHSLDNVFKSCKSGVSQFVQFQADQQSAANV